jgi:hypothetical protein
MKQSMHSGADAFRNPLRIDGIVLAFFIHVLGAKADGQPLYGASEFAFQTACYAGHKEGFGKCL